LRLADEISIRPAPDRGGVPQCEICIAGRATGLRVPGKVFEAAVEIDGRYLVFITEGVTMEELLSIHLVSADGRLLDTAAIGLMYALGIFARLKLEPPREVRFQFLGDVTWIVEIHAEPRWAWPIWREAPGVRRPWTFKRAFRVRTGPPAPAQSPMSA
jgi:hypothetical protein